MKDREIKAQPSNRRVIRILPDGGDVVKMTVCETVASVSPITPSVNSATIAALLTDLAHNQVGQNGGHFR